MSENLTTFFKTLNPSSLRADGGKFEAKLTFEQRCAILACYINGTNRRLLALAFGVNRRTVTHIYNKKSVHYRSVRAELEKLGKEEFTSRYVNEDIIKLIRDTEKAAGSAAILDANDTDVADQPVNIRVPTKMRSKDEGIHTIQPPQCSYSHRVEIAWVNSHLGEGWYFRDLDGSFPEEWMNSGPESILTSTTALRGAEQEVTDRV